MFAAAAAAVVVAPDYCFYEVVDLLVEDRSFCWAEGHLNCTVARNGLVQKAQGDRSVALTCSTTTDQSQKVHLDLEVEEVQQLQEQVKDF